jgi:hypothetical protein
MIYRLRPDFILTQVYFLYILVDGFNHLQGTFLIQPVVSKINFSDAIRYLQTLSKSCNIVVAHSIIFEVVFVLMALELSESVWYGNQIILTAFLKEGSLCFFLMFSPLDTLVYLLVVLEEIYNRFFTDSLIIMKPLGRKSFFCPLRIVRIRS